MEQPLEILFPKAVVIYRPKQENSVKNTFSRTVFEAFAALQHRFCCAKPPTNSRIRKLSLTRKSW